MIELTLPDMTCGHCEKVVRQTVESVAPGARVEVDLPAHRVRIDGAADARAIREALDDAGYPAG